MSTKTPTRLALLAALACVGCCALVPVLTLLGITSAIGLTFYAEMAALGFLVLSLSVFGYALYRRKQLKNALPKTRC